MGLPTYDKIIEGRHLFLRKEIINLRFILDELKPNIKYLHLYCDHLIYDGSVTEGILLIIVPDLKDLIYINIFACSFLDQDQVQGVKFQIKGNLKLKLIFEKTPRQFFVVGNGNNKHVISRDEPAAAFDASTFEFGAHTHAKELITKQYQMNERAINNARATGYLLRISASETQLETIGQVPAGEVQRFSSKEDVKTDFLYQVSSTFNSLPHLLNFLFSKACVLVFGSLAAMSSEDANKDEERALGYLRFICRCTLNAPDYAALNEDAATLLNRLELSQRFPAVESNDTVVGRFFTPLLSYAEYRTSLEAALGLAKDLEESITGLESKQEILTKIDTTGSTVLDTLATTQLGTIPNQENYHKMVDSINKVSDRRIEMSVRGDLLRSRKDYFEKGIQEYADKKKKERDIAIAKGVGEVAVALVIGLCTNPAGAAVTALDLAATVQGAVAETLVQAGDSKVTVDNATGGGDPKAPSKASHVAKGVGKAAISAGPKIVNAWNDHKNNAILNKSAEGAKRQELEKEIQKSQETAGQVITDSSPPIDYLGLLADWDEIRNGVEEVFATLKYQLGNDIIAGMDQYRTTLCNMIVRGQALINAQRQLQEDMRTYYRGWAETRLREQRVRDVKKVAQSLKEQPKVHNGLANDLKASLAVQKRTIVLHFHRCILSLKYRSSRYHSVHTSVDPDMDVSKMRDCATILDKSQGGSKELTTNEQTMPTMKVSTDDAGENVFAQDWKETLLSEHRIPFQVPSTFPRTRKWYDIRVKDLSATFLKEDGEVMKGVEYDVNLGPQFVDFDERRQLNQYFLREFSLGKTDENEQWKFALLSEEQSPAKPGLFCRGSISFDSDQVKTVNLEKVKAIRLVFQTDGRKRK